MSDALAEFGYRVRDARIRKGWTLETLAQHALENPDRKGYVSQIENGKIRISPRTVGNLARVLDLPEFVTEPMLRQSLPAEDIITPADRDAERLIRRAGGDEAAPPTAEALLITLAYEFANGSHIDLPTAYTGLRGALQAADSIKSRGALPQNLDDQLQVVMVMVEVARLNDLGHREEAAAALDDAMKRIDAEREAIFHLQLNQDRVLNRPEAAAKRLIQDLLHRAAAGGVWAATRDLIHTWRKSGQRLGLPFDLSVAHQLAKANLSRAKSAPSSASLSDLALCQLELGRRSPEDKFLRAAVQNFQECLHLTPRIKNAQAWALTENHLGIALGYLADRERDPACTRFSINAYVAALNVYTSDAAPMKWAAVQNNLGIALLRLGEQEKDIAHLRGAITVFEASLTFRTRDAEPTDWAATQSNLGAALQRLGEQEQDIAHLRAAIAACEAALAVRTRDAVPMAWAETQNIVGVTLRWLGTLECDVDALGAAATAFAMCLEVRGQDFSPFFWAVTQWNLADLALAHHLVAPDPQQLAVARHHALAAREVFAEGSDHQTDRCDDLLAKIAASEAL